MKTDKLLHLIQQKNPKRSGGALPLPKAQDGLYNQKRADELGYQRDEQGHLPSVDYTNGMWLKSKEHPTAWMEYFHGQLNPEVANQYNVRLNPEGYFGENQLQYVPKQQIGGSLPKAQIGTATRADSLTVYNNAVALDNFYKKELAKKNIVVSPYDPTNPGLSRTGKINPNKKKDVERFKQDIKNLRQDNSTFYRDEINQRVSGAGKWPLRDKFYKDEYNLSNNDLLKIAKESYAKTSVKDPHKVYYRDVITGQQHLASPLALLDDRILPQDVIEYAPGTLALHSSYPGGAIVVYRYDPIAVKPEDLLTKEEKKIRDKKYPKNEQKPPVNIRPIISKDEYDGLDLFL